VEAPIISSLLADEPDLADLVMQFIDGLPASIQQINTAATTQDWVLLKQKIHDLKGMGGNFGFADLTRIAKQVEAEIASQQYQNIAALLLELDTILERILLGRQS